MKEKRPIGWHLLQNKWLQMSIYFVMIAYFILFKPSLHIILAVLTVYITFKTIYYRKSFRHWVKSLVILGVLFTTIYIVAQLIGYAWTVTLLHIILVPTILYTRRKLLALAFGEMWRHSREMGRKHKEYRKWKKKQKKD